MLFTAALATTAASSLLGARAQNSQARAQNQVVAAQNRQQLLSAAQDVSALNVQAGQVAQDAVQKRQEAVRMANLQSGQQSALAGATGTRGASVDAVQSDISQQLGQQEDQLNQNYQNQMFSIQQQRGQAYGVSRSRMQSAVSSTGASGPLLSWGNTLIGLYSQGVLSRGSLQDNRSTGA